MLFTITENVLDTPRIMIKTVEYPSLTFIEGIHYIKYLKGKQTPVTFLSSQLDSVFQTTGRKTLIYSSNLKYPIPYHKQNQNRIEQWPLMQYDHEYVLIDISSERPVIYIASPYGKMRNSIYLFDNIYPLIDKTYSGSSTISPGSRYAYPLKKVLHINNVEISYAGPSIDIKKAMPRE